LRAGEAPHRVGSSPPRGRSSAADRSLVGAARIGHAADGAEARVGARQRRAEARALLNAALEGYPDAGDLPDLRAARALAVDLAPA
jgi:hypothetical protein